MIKNIIEVSTDFQLSSLPQTEELMQSEIHTPRAWSNKDIALRDIRIVEDISTCCRYSECRRIEETITRRACIRVTNYAGPKTLPVEVPDCVGEFTAYVTWEYGVAVVTAPERSEPRSRLGKHVPGKLPAACHSVSPARDIFAERSTVTKWHIKSTVRDKSMPGDKPINREIRIVIELIVNGSTERRISGVKAARLLVQQCV